MVVCPIIIPTSTVYGIMVTNSSQRRIPYHGLYHGLYHGVPWTTPWELPWSPAESMPVLHGLHLHLRALRATGQAATLPAAALLAALGAVPRLRVLAAVQHLAPWGYLGKRIWIIEYSIEYL